MDIEGGAVRSSFREQSLLMLVAARTFLPIPLEIVMSGTLIETANTPEAALSRYLQPETGLVYTRSQAVPTPVKIPEVEEEEELQEKLEATKKGEQVSKKELRVKNRFAARRTKILGFGKKVAGFLIARLMRPNPENTSQIVQPVTEVVARIVKKQEQPVQLVPAVIAQKVKENTIEDLGLSEVFPKAA